LGIKLALTLAEQAPSAIDSVADGRVGGIRKKKGETAQKKGSAVKFYANQTLGAAIQDLSRFIHSIVQQAPG
jgi:hypothetical protein